MAGAPDGSSVSSVDTDFYDHSVTGSGGAIYAEGDGTLDVKGNGFYRNSADEGGGRGGAIYADRGVAVNVSDSDFIENSAYDAAAIASWGGTMTGLNVTDSTTSEVKVFFCMRGSREGVVDAAGVYEYIDTAIILRGGEGIRDRAKICIYFWFLFSLS